MFQKNDIIFSETLGVCKVTNITKLTQNRGKVYDYYVLKSVFNKEKVSYIPVQNHQVILRELISEEQAIVLKASDNYEKTEDKLKQEIEFVLNQKKKGVKSKK